MVWESAMNRNQLISITHKFDDIVNELKIIIARGDLKDSYL